MALATKTNIKLSPKKIKVDQVFKPDSEGRSNWVCVDDIIAGDLKWSKNGNGRHGIYFNDNRYVWEAERCKRSIVALELQDSVMNICMGQTVR